MSTLKDATWTSINIAEHYRDADNQVNLTGQAETLHQLSIASVMTRFLARHTPMVYGSTISLNSYDTSHLSSFFAHLVIGLKHLCTNH